MAVKNIAYSNKVAISQDPLIPLINQVTADDMNEVKDVVNTNGSELSGILDIIAGMNDFNIDINTDAIKIDLPASSTGVTIPDLDRGVYLCYGSPNRANGISSYTFLAGSSGGGSITTKTNIPYSQSIMIYGKTNCYWLKTVASSIVEVTQPVTPIDKLTSFSNEGQDAKSIYLLKIKSFT